MLPGMARAYAGGREHTLEAMSENKPVNLDGVLADIREHWSPRTIAVVNDYDARVVKVRGEFTRHTHPGTDEFFLVLSGRLTIRMDHGDVVLSKGDVYVVPRQCSPTLFRGRDHLVVVRAERHHQYWRFAELANCERGTGLTSPPKTVLHAVTLYYVEACFMGTQDGRQHTQLGMLRLVRIV